MSAGELLDELRAMGHPHLSCAYRGTMVNGTWAEGPWDVVATSRHTSIQIASGPTERAALISAVDQLRAGAVSS